MTTSTLAQMNNSTPDTQIPSQLAVSIRAILISDFSSVYYFKQLGQRKNIKESLRLISKTLKQWFGLARWEKAET